MKKYTGCILSIGTVMALAVGLSSCKDDEPPAKPKLSFAESEITVGEGDGTVEVELVLDKPYSKDLRIEYDLAGTAKDQDAVGTADADYEVEDDHGVVEIASGATSGAIKLKIYNDALFEEDETIEITITDTNTGDIELTGDDHVVVTITNDDAKVIASFTSTSMTVNEADGVNGFLKIPVQLDIPAPSDITVEYTLGGSALDSTFAYNQNPRIPREYYDYYINAAPELYGKLVIPKGTSTADIEIGVFSDFLFEDDETIEITLKPGAADIGTSNKMTITVQQQDGKVIALQWDDDSYTDVDMDLFLWTGEDIDHLQYVLAFSNFPGVEDKLELVFIPSIITDGAFGLSHTYYSGSADPMTFTVRFIDFTDGQLEDKANEDVFTATYTAANLNPYETTKVTPVIVQTFKIVDGTYTDITAITVPASGSRMRTPDFHGTLRKNRIPLSHRSL